MTNPERVDRVRSALDENQWDLLICALPMNVLMLSGYWPVVGAGLAIAASDGSLRLLVPEDEEDLAKSSWADEVRTFKPGSLERLTTSAEAIRSPLRDLVGSCSGTQLRVGFEHGETSEPASYAAMHLYGGSLGELLKETLSPIKLIPADEALAGLRERKTPVEACLLRRACAVAEKAFRCGSKKIQPGAIEVETASWFHRALSASEPQINDNGRSGGFAWCMSGPNSALAAAAYARSRGRRMASGDLVLVHMNSYVEGYWTDVTRTYALGKGDERRQAMYEAVFAARDAALDVIRPGVKAADVDRAARNVLQDRGFGPQFKHSTGHGVGFSAISANARPRLHPKSPDTLEAGMVFNVEPAIYFEGYGGIRHCDMVTVTENGAELLTPFQCEAEELVLH